MLEYVAIDKRTLVGNIGLAVALTLSGTYQPWLAKYLGHWKPFNWAIFSQMITIFAIPFLLPESCRWLISQGKKEKAVKMWAHSPAWSPSPENQTIERKL